LELINLFDVSTQLAALRAGRIALLSGGPERRQDLKRTNRELVEGPEVIAISISANVMMNTRQKPFDDVRVRQAVMWATERSSYWLSVASEGVPTGPMSSGTKPWRLEDSELPEIPDLTKAKQLLAAAGYANGLQVTSTSTAPYSSPQYTEVTKGQLAKIGINLEIETVDNATWLSRVYRGQDYQTSSYGDYAFDDPDRGLYDYYHSKGGANHTNMNDAQLDQLLDRQRSEMDYDKRHATVLDAQRRLIELAPRVFIHNAITRSLYQPWFKGFREISAAGSAIYRNYQFAWIDKG
jgi:peptide/nickel transport system substrate-binding protein